MKVIDIHNHFFPRDWPDLAKRYGTPDWPWIKHTGPGTATIMMGAQEFRPIRSACWDPDVRLAEMDRDGVDVQVLCATPVLIAYDRTAAQALECARIFNDAALEICARGHGRIKALCQVPLQDADLACKELTRCMKTGHIGVQIGNHVGDRNLDDESLVRFLAHCAAENAPVLVHPWDMMGKERTRRYMMGWTVGMPAETQLAIVAMIFGGAFDRLPKTMKLCFAHGGGSFAYRLGCLENAWHHRDIARGVSKHPPSHYLDRFWTDSAVFDDRALDLLVSVMGEDRVMLGSDSPFPLGEARVGTLVRESASLSDTVRTKILGENAAAFFGLDIAVETAASAL